MLSFIIQAGAVVLSSPAETPVFERMGPAKAAPVPDLGPPVGETMWADDRTVIEDAVHPLVETFQDTPDPTFPPVMTTSARAQEDPELLDTGVPDARLVEDEDGLLENEARETIYDEVTRSPGISMSEVAKRTGIPLSTVRYHTWVLNKEDALEEDKIRGKRRLFPTMMDRERMELSAALEDDATARMLNTVHENEPASVSELAESLDRSASTVSYHLQRLHDAGLIERERDGGATVTTLDPFVRAELSETVVANGGPVDDSNWPATDERQEARSN